MKHDPQERTVRDFAKTQRVKVKRDGDGTFVIFGRHGQIYEYAPGHLGVIILNATARRWRSARRQCLAAGMTLHQDGETEGACLFNPDDEAQARLAIKLAGVKRRRVMSEAQRAALAKAREKSPIAVRTGGF